MRKELKYTYSKWPPKKGVSCEKIPHFCKKSNEWRCMVKGFDDKNYEERGPIEWVMAEFAQYNETYDYYIEEDIRQCDWPNHSHTFSEVLQDVLYCPQHFTVGEFTEQYSQQQLNLIHALKDKLLSSKKAR